MITVSWDDYLAGALDGGKPLAVSIGIFDGVHRGHMALIRRITESSGMTPVVVTFDPSPRTLFGAPERLTLSSLAEKAALLEAVGVAALVVIDFSPAFSALSGEEFVRLLCGGRRVGLIAVGENFRCGHLHKTGAEDLRSLAGAFGVPVGIIPSVMDGGQAVSSSRIRAAAARGDVQTAERLLGRPFEPSRIL